MYRGTLSRDEIFSRLSGYFSSRKDIHTVIVYGSAAKGIFTLESDVDLAVASNHDLSPDERVEIHQALEKELRRKVDLRDLNRLHGIILSNVLLDGEVIKKEDPWYFEKRMAEMIEFRQDILPILREGMVHRLKEWSHGI